MGKLNRIITLAIFLLVLSSLIYAVTVQISSFNSQSNPFNITFIEHDDQTFNLDIPRSAYIPYNFTMEIHGFELNTTNTYFNISTTGNGSSITNLTFDAPRNFILNFSINYSALIKEARIHLTGFVIDNLYPNLTIRLDNVIIYQNDSFNGTISDQVLNTSVLQNCINKGEVNILNNSILNSNNSDDISSGISARWKRLPAYPITISNTGYATLALRLYRGNSDYSAICPYYDIVIYDDNNGIPKDIIARETIYMPDLPLSGSAVETNYSLFNNTLTSGGRYYISFMPMNSSCTSANFMNLGYFTSDPEPIEKYITSNQGETWALDTEELRGIWHKIYISTDRNVICDINFSSLSKGKLQYSDIFINYTLFDIPSNVIIRSGTREIFNNNSIFGFTSKSKFSIFNYTFLNTLLNNSCQLDNVSSEIMGSNCRLNLTFHSDTIGGLQVNLTNATYSFGVDNCSNSFSIPSNATALNISFFDEDNNEENIDFETTIDFWFNISNPYNYSLEIDSINFTEFCIYPSWANFTSNQQIKYTDPFDNIFDYFIFESTLNNITKSLNLFTQNGTTQVLFTVQNLNSNTIEDAYIHILKYNVGTGTYTTTEVIKTDTQGQALGNIVLGTTFYNFLVYFQGVLVYTESAVKLLTTTRTFTVDIEGVDWFTDFETTLGVNTNLYFNNDTQNFVYTWSDPSSLMHFGCLRVDKSNDTGRFNLSNTCTETTSGTIIYHIDILENGTDYIATGYLKYGNEIITDLLWYTIAKARDFFQMDAMGSLFIAFLLCLTLFMIGIPNPTISLAFLGAGVIFSSMLGLWAISGMMLGSIIFLILLQLYLAGRQSQ